MNSKEQADRMAQKCADAYVCSAVGVFCEDIIMREIPLEELLEVARCADAHWEAAHSNIGWNEFNKKYGFDLNHSKEKLKSALSKLREKGVEL